MKNVLLGFVLTGVMALLAACGSATPTPLPTIISNEAQPTAAADVNPTATITATAEVIVIVPTNEAPPPAEATATTPPPTATATPPAEPTATTQPSAAACLVGRWRVSNFETYLQQTLMANAPGTDITLTVSSGEIYITFTASEMSMASENYVVAVAVAGTSLDTQVEATGQVEYTATDTNFTTVAGTTTGSTTGSSMGQSMTIDLAQMVGGGTATTVAYTCAGDVMTWSGPYVVPMEFERVNN